MLNPDDWKIAIEDARTRHAAVISLIYFTDTQAMALLRVYLTVGIVAAGAAVAGLGNGAVIPWATGLALGAATVILLIGSVFCFEAMSAATINLPGRPADFWLWAAHQDIPREAAFTDYLKNLDTKGPMNDTVAAASAWYLNRAKWCGIIAPMVSLAVGVIALYTRA